MLGGAARGALLREKNANLAQELLDRAVESLEQAIAVAPSGSNAAAPTQRALGLMLHDWPEGVRYPCRSKSALERYLELRPAAADADMIRAKIRDLAC
jgi:hypothetical protein